MFQSEWREFPSAPCREYVGDLNERHMTRWSKFKCLRAVYSFGLMLTRKWLFEFRKCLGISSLFKRLLISEKD